MAACRATVYSLLPGEGKGTYRTLASACFVFQSLGCSHGPYSLQLSWFSGSKFIRDYISPLTSNTLSSFDAGHLEDVLYRSELIRQLMAGLVIR